MVLLRSASLLALASLALSAHAQFYTTTPLPLSQNSLTVTSLPNGNNLWTTNLNATNDTSSILRVYFVPVGFRLNGVQSNWDDAATAWRQGSDVSQSVNEAFHLSMDRSVTDAPLDPAHGVTTSVSLDAFLVGDLLPGASSSFLVQREITPGVGSIGTTLVFVTTPVPVPEPASMAALGLGAAAMLRRRKRA